ncbi:MAG TPA: mechanosensitive ion channel family protein [Pseudolabrys sp.]|nr:mechanosensitive ion channel family protein [Pseudolabrys sp.]
MDSIRSVVIGTKDWLDWLPNPVVAVLVLGLAVIAALALHNWVFQLMHRLIAYRNANTFSLFSKTANLTRLALITLAMIIVIPAAPLRAESAEILARLLSMAVIGLIGWTTIVVLQIAAEAYLRRFRLDVDDNLLARKHNTQIRILLRAVDGIIVLVTIGAALMTIPSVRQYGISLFASAGIAGIAAGLAARPVLSNLMAGVQLAMTQPIRLYDAVIVEGEYGTIEEIGSTFVTVKLWDLRRMVVPLTYFIEKPFQNWTRESSLLIGNVMLYVDYCAPVAVIRDKLYEILKQSDKWDGKTAALQVTDFKEGSMELRCLMSARLPGQTFDLRCEVREKLVDFLQREHPEALPHLRQIKISRETPEKASQEAARKHPDNASPVEG